MSAGKKVVLKVAVSLCAVAVQEEI